MHEHSPDESEKAEKRDDSGRVPRGERAPGKSHRGRSKRQERDPEKCQAFHASLLKNDCGIPVAALPDCKFMR